MSNITDMTQKNIECSIKKWLVGGLEHGLFIFHFIYGMSSFPLTFIFSRGVGQPPTSSCLNHKKMKIFTG